MAIQYDKHGNGYEESKIYEFSYDEIDWKEGYFNRISSSGKYVRAKSNVIYPYIRECQAELGKVCKRPVDLKKGDCCKWITGGEGEVYFGWYRGVDADGLRIADTPNGETHNLDHESVRDIKRMIEAPNTDKQE